jgi:hypothetical protein
MSGQKVKSHDTRPKPTPLPAQTLLPVSRLGYAELIQLGLLIATAVYAILTLLMLRAVWRSTRAAEESVAVMRESTTLTRTALHAAERPLVIVEKLAPIGSDFESIPIQYKNVGKSPATRVIYATSTIMARTKTPPLPAVVFNGQTEDEIALAPGEDYYFMRSFAGIAADTRQAIRNGKIFMIVYVVMWYTDPLSPAVMTVEDRPYRTTACFLYRPVTDDWQLCSSGNTYK